MRGFRWTIVALIAGCSVPQPAEVGIYADPGVLDLVRVAPDGDVLAVDLRLGNTGADCLRIDAVEVDGPAGERLSVEVPRPARVLRPGEVTDLRVRVDEVPFHAIPGRSDVVVTVGPATGIDGCNTLGEPAATLRVPIVAGLPAWCDSDGDGFIAEVCGGRDCADDDPARPAAHEVCNGIDDTCDGQVDVDAVDALPWYADADGDGFGDPGVMVLACEAPDGFVADDTDCDDTDPDIFPGAQERCNGLDDDCDTVIDNGLDLQSFWADADGDGFGDPDAEILACEAPPGTVADDTDCDDTNPDVNPDAHEICDGIDNNCDDQVDVDPVSGPTWFEDTDGDGWGAGPALIACDQPAGWVARSGDCDDTRADVYPGAPEFCDGTDNDCDTFIDNDPVDGDAFYPDDDGDGWGDSDLEVIACEAPIGHVGQGGDCDDDDPDINPGMTEQCNGRDDNCSGLIDDGAGVCPCPVVHRGDYAYGLCDISLTWSLARQGCQSANYDLAWIDDADEDRFLTEQVRAISTTGWWIGLNDRATEGTWLWADGATPRFTRWAPGSPRGGFNLLDCAQIGGVPGWVDAACLNFQPFVCKAGP